MSPRPAFSPVAPPSGRIICSLRAPELSATSSMLLIITAMATLPRSFPLALLYVLLQHDLWHQRRLAHNVLQLPPLQLRQRTRLFDSHHVALVRFIFFVL